MGSLQLAHTSQELCHALPVNRRKSGRPKKTGTTLSPDQPSLYCCPPSTPHPPFPFHIPRPELTFLWLTINEAEKKQAQRQSGASPFVLSPSSSLPQPLHPPSPRAEVTLYSSRDVKIQELVNPHPSGTLCQQRPVLYYVTFWIQLNLTSSSRTHHNRLDQRTVLGDVVVFDFEETTTTVCVKRLHLDRKWT